MLAAVDDDDAPLARQLSACRRETLPPRSFGDYVLGEALGHGGMSSVYRASHPRHGEVALKILSSQVTVFPQTLERFRREAEVMRSIRHPALCGFYELAAANDRVAIVMELIDGEDLDRVLERRTLPVARSLAIATELSDLLALIHARGIVHRDIKPSNVMITNDGSIRLIDFGVARLADTRLTMTGQRVGSPYYMSPEQWRGESVDSRADIWSLGMLLCHLCWNELPFDGETLADIAEEILGSSPLSLPGHAGVDPVLDQLAPLVARMLEKDRTRRYPSMLELRSELTRVQAGSAAAASTTDRP